MKRSQLTIAAIGIGAGILAGLALRSDRKSADEAIAAAQAVAAPSAAPQKISSAPVAGLPLPPASLRPAASTATSAPRKPATDATDAELEKLRQELTNADNTFFDPEYRFTGKIPAGWLLRDAPRWGKEETTLHFKDPEFPQAVPNLYYRKFPEPMALEGPAIYRWMEEQAAIKATQRAADGRADYINREIAQRTIGDRPALTWTADFTYEGEPWAEYLTRVYSPTGTTLFFMSAPKKDMPTLIPRFESLIQKTITP